MFGVSVHLTPQLEITKKLSKKIEESRECMYFRCNCAEFVSWRALHGSSINLFRTTCIKCWRIMDSI
ncbi:unnamed protein product [Rhizophagus irregularis]|uniref:Uncharacterized protein n=1 Tax=Rhizophagus irregularis TaxID=588596 RepID=A0A915ZGN2_9GLOM|nr:unnamed protein product [Rhizophagus irregularis]CAB5207354.1 unnamed protein product [Rhizophagus irregularis]CAB5373913.1 unnamed protein product [Rhizophagus irregularis]